MFRWPNRSEVHSALQTWTTAAATLHPELRLFGCFGSYARCDWGVGSDLDLVAVVDSCDVPFERRSANWDLNGLPVPAELLVYTQEEWDRLQSEGGRFAVTLAREAVWLFSRSAKP